jgi:hypothetical protein
MKTLPSSRFLGVVHEFGYRLDAGNQQMIARAGAGDVEQVALSIIDFLQINERAVARFSMIRASYCWRYGLAGGGGSLLRTRLCQPSTG